MGYMQNHAIKTAGLMGRMLLGTTVKNFVSDSLKKERNIIKMEASLYTQ